MQPILPVILSGGAGQRLWPLSRRGYPKQLLPLTGERSLLQETALRVADPAHFADPLLVANEEHRFLVAEQLRSVGVTPRAILLEPVGRNTAAAVAVAALAAAERDPETVLALLPADHDIGDPAALRALLWQARPAAAAGRIVTFGIDPTRPETGYGYIRSGTPLPGHDGVAAVEAFVEKPDRATAESYLAAGGYLWNSGMFLARAETLLAELGRFAPEVLAAAEAALAGRREDLDFQRLDRAALEAAPAVSFDVAVMERTDRSAVLPCRLDWSDLGAWQALWERGEKDPAGNVARGLVRSRDAEGCYLRSDDGRLLAVLGLRDLVMVVTRDAVLAAPRERAAEVGALVDALKAEGREEVLQPSVRHRPWGSYEDLAEGPRFRVKRILVAPGGRLSLQYHRHRSEHWVVVEGRATVQRGEETLELEPNQSIYVPTGEKHRLENRTQEPLVLVEVQCGDYVGEDDIVRLEDVYGRPDSETSRR